MIKTATGLKAKVRNVSKGDSRVAQAMIRIFFMERFLERLSVSKYKDRFVLKGGMCDYTRGYRIQMSVDV